MPISRSAHKSLRVSRRRATENKIIKLRVKSRLKQSTAETLPQTFSMLDKAAKNHVIHKNKAARLKSRLAKKLANMAESPASKPAKPARAAKAAPKTKRS